MLLDGFPKKFVAGEEAHAMPAMPESESSSDSSASSQSDDSSSSESISLRELFLRLEEDLEGFLDEDLDKDFEVELSFSLKNFFVLFSSLEL